MSSPPGINAQNGFCFSFSEPNNVKLHYIFFAITHSYFNFHMSNSRSRTEEWIHAIEKSARRKNIDYTLGCSSLSVRRTTRALRGVKLYFVLIFSGEFSNCLFQEVFALLTMLRWSASYIFSTPAWISLQILLRTLLVHNVISEVFILLLEFPRILKRKDLLAKLK